MKKASKGSIFSRPFVGIQVTVVTIFIVATLTTATIAISLQYYFSKSLAKQAAHELYLNSSSNIDEQLQQINDRAKDLVNLLAENAKTLNQENQTAFRDIFINALKQNRLFYGLYVAKPNGDFFEVINLHSSESARDALLATPDDRWILINISGKEPNRYRKYYYLDEQFNIRTTRQEATNYDPRNRPWYQSANSESSQNVSQTEPYLFANLQVSGQTFSKKIPNNDSIIGLDILLSTLSSLLKNQAFKAGTNAYLFKNDGQLIASSKTNNLANYPKGDSELSLTPEEKAYISDLPEIKVSNELDWPPIDYALSGEPRGYSIDMIKIIADITGIKIRFVNGSDWNSLVNQYKKGELDILHSVLLTENNSQWGPHSQSYVSLPYALASSVKDGNSFSTLDELNGKKLAIPEGWSIKPVIEQEYQHIEIVDSKSTLHSLQLVRENKVDAALDTLIIMQYIKKYYFLDGITFKKITNFNDQDIPDKLHIFVQEDKKILLNIINKAINAITDEQKNWLADKWLDLNSYKLSEEAGVVPSSDLLTIARNQKLHNQLQPISYRGEPYFAYVSVFDAINNSPRYFGVLVPRQNVMGTFINQVIISSAITAGLLLLVIPFSWFFAKPIVTPIRQLAMENDKVRMRRYDEVERVPSHIHEIVELSTSMIDMVESIQAHEQAQKDLLDSFIKLIAQAIDDKSPYTGGHCERVPELALMLVNAACDSHDHQFEHFQMQTEDEWREFRIAAWLHDCGKITTPEHIVDKAVKLETIYNRIHEVRTRFEVLWRDEIIEHLQKLHANPSEEEILKAELDAAHQKLQDDFAFIAECNIGGEFLSEDKVSRLNQIAQRKWFRYFSNRLGLSAVELSKHSTLEEKLPVEEPLISDRPVHIFKRTRSTDYPKEYGINMDIPENLYNLGELYNLSISRGTLTPEDRFKINEHMISTIKMLEALPFPDELKRVPRYASTHHETMSGKGYPRKLPGEALSIPERLLAISDVYEALTASDRPYKKAKTISESIKIMSFMVKDNHLDRDSFRLFLKSGVYLDYAKRYLKPEQIDEVDLEKYLSVEPRVNES